MYNSVWYKFIALPIFLMLALQLNAQDKDKEQEEDKSALVAIRCIHPQISFEFPTGDLGKRFGSFSKLGAGYLRKTKNNLLYGARLSFITGSNVKEDSLLINVKTADGNFISGNGVLGNLAVFQRGYETSLSFGKIFPISQKRPNSGIYWLGAYGFNQYKMKFFDADKRYTYFQDGYYKGYDRLTNGLFTTQQLGYMFFNGKKPINFNIGIQGTYAANQGRRDWLFDVQRSGLDKRNDMSFGIVAGWIITVYKKKVEDKYY